MTTKASVLRILEENRDRFLSGEEIASMLGVSRSAVWKAVKSLEAVGYAVSAVTNKGYGLSADPDIL